MTPKLKEERARELLAGITQPVALLGVRGYYRDTLGVPGRNDVGIYDDAIFLVGPTVFRAVRANTDPSRLGWNGSLGKPFAMLQPGDWMFIRGAHKGRAPALRQADEDQAAKFGIPDNGHFKVWRAKNMDDVLNGTARTEEGYFAINIHSGGDNTTSSWGCQTLPPDEFIGFMDAVWSASKRANQNVIPYRLINGPVS